MITLIKYGALGGGEKYNANIMYIDGLSTTDTKPTGTFEGMPIPNASVYTEIDTGKQYRYDAAGATWHQSTAGGGGGGGTSDAVHGLSSGTTEDHIVTWGADGYHVKDSGATLAANYIELASGQRVYFSSTAPTGTIPDGSIGIGF